MALRHSETRPRPGRDVCNPKMSFCGPRKLDLARGTDKVAPDYGRRSGRKSTGRWGVFTPLGAGRSNVIPLQGETMSTTTTLLPHHHHHHSAPSLSPSSSSTITGDPEGQATLPRSPRRSFSPPRPPPPSTEEFRPAITQMYSGRSAIELLPPIGLRGPISIEQLRSHASSSSSQATRIGPLRADHTLPTPRSASDREIEDINRRAAEEVQRSQARAPHRPLSSQQHATYHIDLKDDTDPREDGTGSPCDTSRDSGLARPESVRRKRVYLIKRPHSAPVYGRITPVPDAEESLPPVRSSRAGGGRIPDPQSASASEKEGSPDFLRKIPVSSQGSRIPQVTVSEKHVSNFDQQVHSSASKTRDDSQVGDDNCDPVLSGHVSPVQFVESEGDWKIHREQSVQTKTPSAHCQCPNVPVDSDRDVVKKIPWLQCEHFESTDSAGKHREQLSPNTVSDGVNSLNDSHDTECSPSRLATRLPVTSVDQSVTEGDCRSTSIVQTHPRHSRTDSKRARGQRPEEESTFISGVTNKDPLHHSSRHFLSDDSSLPHSEALNTQPTSHSTEFHTGVTVEDRSIRTQNTESIPILEENLNNTVCGLETVQTSRDSSSYVSKESDPHRQQTNLPSHTEFSDSQESLQQLRDKTPYLRTSSVPQSSTLPARGSPRDSSNLQLSHINFGSVDNFFVGLDTETTFSKKKTKKKKSVFKSWFTPKKGKYLPGKETVPFIETPLELSSPTLNSRGSQCPSSQPSARLKDKKSSLQKDSVGCSSLNTNNSNCQLQDSAESGAAAFRDRMEKLLAQQPHSDTTPTDTPQGKLAAKTDDGKLLTTMTDNGSQSQISGDASDRQSLSSVDSKTSAGSGKVFSLLSSKVLKGGASGAYENTNVKFNTNVTRHEVITIKGSSHTTMDKSIMLNESSFPDDLTSTFKTKPVMVRERKVSSGSSQEQPALTTFSGPDSESVSSLSLAELESHGAIKLSSRQGSENDLELLSTASRIVQAQRSDGTMDDPTDDDHELVVIREYVFAARKTSTEGGTSSGTTPREVTIATSSDSVHTTDHAPLDGRENPPSSLSALRENDSGVDSPPSLQECHLPPVKPKRSGRGSKEVSKDEIHTLKTLPPDNENMEKVSFPAVHATLPPGPDVTVIPGDSEESSKNSHLLTSAGSFVDKLFTQQQSQPVECVNDSADNLTSKKNKPHTDDKKPSPLTMLTKSGPDDPSSCQENRLDQDSRPDELIVAAAEEMLETSPEREGNSVGPDSVAGKLQQGAKKEPKENSGIRVTLPSNESPSVGDGLQNVWSQTPDDLPRTDAGNSLPKFSERKVDATSAPVLQSSVPTQPEKPVAKHEQDKDPGTKHTSDDKPEGFARWSRYRDSLSEEEYNKPWESDFTSIEEDIRSKITQAFPSVQEEDEHEQRKSPTETDISGHVKASLESLSFSTGKQSAGKPESDKNKGLEDANVSAAMDNTSKDSVEDSANQCQAILQTTENVPAKTEARAGSKQNTEAKTLPAAAGLTLSPASKPRKTSAQFERPLLPQPPPPPPAAKIPKEETKPVHSEKPHPEKPHKTNAAEKDSPLHHRKLKEKFKKVFSHSSEDKKQPKAEHKKTTPLMKKKDVASPKDDRAANNEQKKSEMSNLSSKPDEVKTKPVDGNEGVQTADHHSGDETEAPDHDYMLANIPSAERGPADESSDPQDQDSLLYTSINHEVKLPFSPKEARKLLKAEKKNAAKTQAEEGKDSSSMDETKLGSPRSPNRALKWIRKKLATKGKKIPHSKKYTISGPDELEADEGDLSSREAKSPRASDTNSESEDSHDSSDSCHSESEEEEEGKTKPPRKIPFWGGKKDKKTKKKKAAQTESDSDSSAEESKLKLFSWSLGRKKGNDSSDHEDNLPSSYKKTTEWTPSEESSGVSGTFRKISDDVPQKQNQAQAAAPGQQKDNVEEAGIKITVTDASTDIKETSDTIPASETSDLLKQAETASNTDTDTQRISGKDSASDSTHHKLFSFEECEEPPHKTYDDGEYAKLREDAAVKPNSDKLWKQSKSSGYVLARPMFLEDESDDDASSQAERMTEAHSNLSYGKMSESQTVKQHPGKDKSENSISEDTIIPSKAARPVHQAFSSLEKLSGQELRERIPDVEPPSSPELQAKQKRVTFAKPPPQPQPQQLKKEAQGHPATEDEIVPSKADDAFWGLRVNRGSINKSESPVKKDDSENSGVPKTGSRPEVMLDSDVHPDSTQLPDIKHQTSMNTDLTFNSQPAVSFTDSPRSNADSDDSAGRTYLDKPGFLEVAKASWGHADGKSSKAAHSKPDAPEADADPGKKLVIDTGPSGAGKTSENTAPGSVFGVTLKKREVLKDTEKGSSDSQVDSQDPKQEESSNTNSHDAQGLDQPDFSATTENPENRSSNMNKPDAFPKHPVAVKGMETVASDDASLMLSPSTNRRKTRAVTPSELKSARHQDAASATVHPKPVTKTPSPTDDSDNSPIDWLDSGKSITTSKAHSPRPGKPSTIAPKPQISAKPKLVQGKGKVEFPPAKLKQDIPAEDAQKVLFPSEIPAIQHKAKDTISVTHGMQGTQKADKDTSKPAVREKPIPPSKPSKPAKATPVSEVNEASKTSPGVKSLEPKPRKLLKDSKDNPGKPGKADVPPQHQTKNIQQGINFGEVSTVLSTPSTDSYHQESSTDPSTSTWGEDSEATLDPCVGEFTLALETRSGGSEKKPSAEKVTQQGTNTEGVSMLVSTPATDESRQESHTYPSTMSLGENSESPTNPCFGEFTLGLETHTGGSEKKRDPSRGDTDGNQEDTNLSAIDGSMNPPKSGSEFTNVTDLVESQTTSKFSPFSQSTPLTSNPASSASTSDDVTLSSISTIQRSELPSERTSEQHDSDIYEPIFFEDLHDPRSSRPTEAPPVRPEKVGKRRLDPPRIVAPEFDDDLDNMYDVPRTHQTFAFPTESSLPVLSIIDKRGSKTSLTSMKSLEPEDTIPPYATCHKSPQFVKLESDYGDDENPYMNEEELQSLPSSRSPVAEKPDETHDAEETVHASLRELFPEASSGKEETLPSGETRNVDEVDTVDSPSSDKPDSVKSSAKKFTVGSSSSESSSRSESLSSDEGLAADTKVKKNETESKSDENDKADKAPEEEDQYLKSPEYQHSVEEINKLYAALEKEEREMEKQSSSTEPQSPGISAPTRTCRLLSFEDQRAELKPLKPKLADIPSEQTWDLEKQKAETPSNKKGSNDSKQTKPVGAVRKHSSSSKKSPPPSKGGHKTNSPQASPRLQKRSSKSQDEPERAQAEIHQLTDKEGDAKETHASKDSALHRLAGLFKSGIKGSPGTDRKVKAMPEEHDQGSKGGDGEKERGQRTSGKEDDFPNPEVEPQEPSLVTEVFQHQMYAQVHKTPADSSKPPANTSQQGPEEEEASPPPVVGSPPTPKKTSTLSSFFVTKPKPHPGQKPDKMAVETEKSDTTKSDGSPKTGRVSKMATIGVKMPFAGVVSSKSKDLPQEDQEKEKDGNDKGIDESVSEQPVEVSVEMTTSSETSVLKSSPEAAADSPEPGEPTSPSKTGPEPPKKPIAPKPLKKPGIWKPLQKPGEPEPATKPGTKTQPKPRDLTRTYSDVDTKLKVPPHPDPLPEVAFETPDNPEGEEAPEVPTRHSSLQTPDSVLENTPLSEPTKALPEIPPHVHRNRLRVPGAGAANESEDSEEEETTEDEDGDEDGGSDHQDGDNPPLPERRYRETQAKYNEYSNVIRVDSTKLKEARLRSLSRPVLTEDLPDKKDEVSKLRNALSLEAGLDKKGKKVEKKRKKKTAGEEGGEGGERKGGKKPFLLRSFKDLFGKKKKKSKGGGEGEEGEMEEEEEAENVYEVVDDTATEPKSKGAALTKHTWPKQKKRKKSESGDHPPTTHHPPLVAVDSSHASKDIRPIGRLLQLNPDGTQMVELIRPPNGQLGVQLTQGNEETLQGKFVSGFVDKSTQKLLSGILHIGDQILKINDTTIDDCPLIEVHNIIDSQQRLKFLVYPGDNQ